MPPGEVAMNFRAWHPVTPAAGSVRHTAVAATVSIAVNSPTCYRATRHQVHVKHTCSQHTNGSDCSRVCRVQSGQGKANTDTHGGHTVHV